MFKKRRFNKFLVVFAAYFIVPFSVFSQYAETDKEMIGLVGSVKIVVNENADIMKESGKYIEKNREYFRTVTYDLKGNVISEEPVPGREAPPMSGPTRKEEPKTKLLYNKKGKILEDQQVLKDGTIVSKSKYQYDSKGCLIELRYYDLNESTHTLELWRKRLYERKDNTVKTTLYEGCCSTKQWHLVTFNKRKDITEIASYKKDDSLNYKTAYSYEYDSMGNWVKRTSSWWKSENGKSFFEPREVNYRTITYY